MYSCVTSPAKRPGSRPYPFYWNVCCIYRDAVKQVKNLSVFSPRGMPTVFGAAGFYSEV